MTWLAYFIAGISTAGFVSIWFITSAKDLSQAKRDVEGAIRQLQIQEDTYPQTRDAPYEKTASNSLETTRMIYRETVKSGASARLRSRRQKDCCIC